jgi:hypothetical protein
VKGYRTGRFCHQINMLPVGFKGGKGTVIGKMSGEGGVPAHAHIEVGFGKNRWQNLTKFTKGEIKSDEKTLRKIINWDLFGTTPVITGKYLEEGYREKYGGGTKEHYAIDAVPIDRHKSEKHFDIHWSLDCEFEVIAVGKYSDGTTYMIIYFEVEEDDMRVDVGEKFPKKDFIPNSGEPLKLDKEWQYEELAKSIRLLRDKGIMNDDEWYLKVKSKQITIDELTWINTILISRLLKEIK